MCAAKRSPSGSFCEAMMRSTALRCTVMPPREKPMMAMRCGSMRGCVASSRNAAKASAVSAAKGTCDWSSAVLLTPRGPKLSIENTAMPAALKALGQKSSMAL